MNTRKAILVLTAVAAAAGSSYGEKVRLEETPRAVQKAIERKAGGAQVEDIDREVRNGEVTYEASWKANGAQQEFLVSEKGTILRDIVGGSSGLSNQNLTLANKTGVSMNEAPPAVQKAIRNQLHNAPVDYIQRGTWNGQNIYEFTYRENGQLRQAQVTESGQPVVGNAHAIGWQPRYAGITDSNVPLGGGAKLAVNDAPQAVQTTVSHMTGGAPVEDFERGQWNGRTIYEAAFKQDGKHVELQVLEDGTLLTKEPAGGAEKQVVVGSRSGGSKQNKQVQPKQVTKTTNPPKQSKTDKTFGAISDAFKNWQNKDGTDADSGASAAGDRVEIQNHNTIRLTEAPSAVQSAINRNAGGARINSIQRGDWNGRTVYSAGFQQNGQHNELQILDDGSVLSNGPVASGRPAGAVSGGGNRYQQ